MDLQTNIGNLSGNVERDIKALHSAVFNLAEEVRYMMNNLDVTNFNDLGLARYENGRLQIYTEEMDIRAEKLTAEFRAADSEMQATLELSVNGLKTEFQAADEALKTTLEASVDGLSSTVTSLSGTVDGLDSDLGTLSGTVTALSGTVSSNYSSLSSRITQNANKITAVVSAVDDSSGNVTAASIVAAINSAGSSVKISADHVNITGFVTVSDLAGNGTVEINAGNLKAGGTISGVALESRGSASWEQVLISNGMIDFYSGYIQDYDIGILEVYANTTLRLSAGDSIQLMMPNGRYFEFVNGALNYRSKYGELISSAVFQ